MTEHQEFNVRSRIVFGSGVVRTIGTETNRLGVGRALLVSDKQILGAGLLEGIAESLHEAGVKCVIFDEGEPDPSAEVVDRGAEIVEEEGIELLVALGGGSNMDTAKGMAVAVALSMPIAKCRGWIERFDNRPPPVIAIPTTAGTAAEITPFAVITDQEQRCKYWVGGAAIAPKVALLDPEMLTTAPRMVRVAAGMDALTHAVESHISKRANPYTEMCGLRGVELIAANLPAAAADRPSIEALSKMQIAANIAGIAFANAGLGIVHAAALPLGALFGVPHGVANGILLPHGMAFNRPACEEKLAELATSLGAKVGGMNREEASWAAIKAIRTLTGRIGAPGRLRDVGVREESFPMMASEAIQNSHLRINPRDVTEQDLIALYQAAL